MIDTIQLEVLGFKTIICTDLELSMAYGPELHTNNGCYLMQYNRVYKVNGDVVEAFYILGHRLEQLPDCDELDYLADFMEDNNL